MEARGGLGLAEAGQDDPQRVAGVTLEVTRPDGTGRVDGFLTERTGLGHARMQHVHLPQAAEGSRCA